MKRQVAAVLSLSMVLAACSSQTISGKAQSAPPTSLGSTASAGHSRPPATPNLNTQLLTVSDLPIGWAVDNSSSSGSNDQPSCLKQATPVAHAVTHAGVAFTMGSTFPRIFETIGRFADAATAETEFVALSQVLDSCTDVSGTSGGTRFTGTIGSMSFPTIASGSKAWAMTFQAQGISFGFDLVLFHKGPEMQLIALADLGSPSIADLATFTRIAARKMP